MAKTARKGKVDIDCRRNRRGATTVAPYSTRAREGAPVSVPVPWDEVETLRGPAAYTVSNVRQRLTALEADPWQELPSVGQSITARTWKGLGR